MATIDWPSGLVPAKVTWGLQSNTEVFTSPLNRSSQTVERPGARWKATWEFAPRDDDSRGQLEAFLASLGGMAGRFTVWPHQRPGSALYIAQVNGNLTNFKQLPTKNWPANTKVLRAGDFLAVGGELKMVTADVFTDGVGHAVVNVAPAFRKAPGIDDIIALNKPRTTMLLATDEYSVSTLPGRIGDSVVVSAIEAFS